jgi:hypothetical protein
MAVSFDAPDRNGKRRNDAAKFEALYEKLHVHSRTEATVKFLGRD